MPPMSYARVLAAVLMLVAAIVVVWRNEVSGGGAHAAVGGEQGQPGGDRLERIAPLDAPGREAAVEEAPHRRDVGGAARDEDGVDTARREAGAGEHGVDGAVDGGEVVGDPGLEVGALHVRDDGDAVTGEAQPRPMVARQGPPCTRPPRGTGRAPCPSRPR